MTKDNPDKTVVTEWLDSKVIGYTINLGVSTENQECLGLIIKDLKDKLPELIWPMPPEKLHVTLFDWIASLVDYGRDKDEIFLEIFGAYDKALEKVLVDQRPFTINFTELRITPDAVIAIGNDDGSFQKIRNAFLSEVNLIPGSKPFPKIIHTTLCRFLKEGSIESIADVLRGHSISFYQYVNNFRLLKIFEAPMIKSEFIKEYALK